MSEPICPRCGYDQSGAAASWENSCPLKGTCSECGQELVWADVFDPARRDVAGFVEHVDGGGVGVLEVVGGWWRVLVCAWRTLAWVILGVFWRRVGVEHRVVLWRAVLWLVLTLGMVHAGASLLGCLRIYGMRWALPVYTGGLRSGVAAGAMSTEATIWHMVWCWTYPVCNAGWGGVGLGAARLMVLSWPEAVLATLGAHAAMVGMLLLLPTTRRLAKVRPAHVLRAGVYGLAWVVWLALFRLVRNVDASIEVFANRSSRVLRIEELPSELVWMFTAGWVALWWLLTLRQGWKLRRAWVVWAVLGAPAVLAGINVVAWVEV